jgi:hypothetical protein
MSSADADRLFTDLQKNKQIKDKFKSAGSDGFERVASSEGYHVTKDEFSNAVKAFVVKQDLEGPNGFQVVDGIVSGVAGGVTSHVSAVGTGIA